MIRCVKRHLRCRMSERVAPRHVLVALSVLFRRRGGQGWHLEANGRKCARKGRLMP